MTIHDALRFIQRVRDQDIRLSLEPRQPETLMNLIEIARKHDLNFTESEFRTAFRQDWAERWMKLKG